VKLKVDENISRSGIELLRQETHDVASVPEQGLAGAADEALFRVCVAERRTLVTLDRDFGQVPRFPPSASAGIVILELGGAASRSLLHDRLRDFLALAAVRSADGELWIVEPGRVRVHLPREDNEA
jgi:predicted nuclease of predicted toxin-antitoxin system